MFASTLREWIRKFEFGHPARTTQRRSKIGQGVEPLEELAMLSAFPVTTTADSGAGSLRQAILSRFWHSQPSRVP